MCVWDRSSDTTINVSADSGGREPNDGAAAMAISGDGRWILFASEATDLFPPYSASLPTHLYRRAVASRETTRVSL